LKEIALYIHIPFCIKKCFYCDFCSFDTMNNKIEDYFSALISEMEMQKEILNDYVVKTIFIGGGTPSMVSISEMDRLFRSLYKEFNISNEAEISLESNPGTLTEEKIRFYLDIGINRLSIGLQAWQNHLLKKMGRIHSQSDFIKNYTCARELGFNNINIDLMFGLPDQSFKDWEKTLKEVAALSPEHISAYSLKIEKDTRFFSLLESRKLILPNDEEDRKMYHHTISFLRENNYKHYEISNFAKGKNQCRHNMVYWNNEEYLGVGLGAHSYFNKSRYSNIEDVDQYIAMLHRKSLPCAFKLSTALKDEIEETMFLGLRKTEGIYTKDFTHRFGISPFKIYLKQLQDLEKKGLICMKEGNICLTLKGYDLSNQVLIEFLLDDTTDINIQ